MIDKYLNKIVCGDSLTVMKELPDNCLDLVVTSPPYNLKNSTGNGMKACTTSGKWAGAALQNGYSHYDDNMPHEEYAEWQHNCLKEMYRLIKDDGAVFYNHKWRVQDGLIQDRKDIIRDLPVRQIIIWRRKGGINFNPGYFLPTYEVIYLITKPKFKLVPKANAFGDVWEFTQEMKNEHPAPFPVALIDRIISSTNAKLVLDPFSGSGTTAIILVLNFHRTIVKILKKIIMAFQQCRLQTLKPTLSVKAVGLSATIFFSIAQMPRQKKGFSLLSLTQRNPKLCGNYSKNEISRSL